MDYPKSVPNVGLVDGKFIDENTATGQPGSLIPSKWGNDITGEILNVIEAAGLAPTEADLTQLLQAIRGVVQVAAGSYAADTGVANAYAAAYSPAVVTLVDGLTLRFKAKAGNSGGSTFSPNGLVARPILGLGLLGLQGNEIAANGLCAVTWSATLSSWVLVQNSGGPMQVSPATRAAHAITAGQQQQQSATAFTTSGAGPALTLSPLPLLATYVANQRFRVKFGAASTGADTLNISNQGAKNLKQYDSSGAKVAAVFAANQLSDVEFDGVDMVVMDPLMPVATTAAKGTVQLGSAADVLAGTSPTLVPSIAAMVGGLLGAGGSSATDYVTIPFKDKTTGARLNLIVQWGTVSSLAAESVATVTMPLTYTAVHLGGIATIKRSTSISGGVNSAYYNPTNLSQAVVVNDGNLGATADVFWLSMGL